MSLILSNFEKSKAHSNDCLARLRERLNAEIGGQDILVGTSGSYARREASAESDLDYFIVCRTENETSEIKRQKNKIQKAIKEIVEKSPSDGGAFDSVESIDTMLKNIGGADDDNNKFTRRSLIFLEGDWLYNEFFLEELRTKLIDRYVKDLISDHQIALFLLNDFLRYYRTICVDFEFKTQETGKDWGTRNIKLVFSRKLLYFSGVLSIAETYSRTAAEKRARLAELFRMPVIERIYHICGPSADRALSIYDEFLGEFAKAEVRKACKEAQPDHRQDFEVFRRLKNKGHEFSGRLISLLHEIYDPGHPIHRALIL